MSENIDPQDLLKEGETIEEWWIRNGLSAEAAQKQRKQTYIEQLKAAAVVMDKFYQRQK